MGWVAPGHTHRKPVVSTSVVSGAMSSRGIRDQDPSCEAVPMEGWMGCGVNGVQKDRQNHRTSGAAGLYPTSLAMPPSSPQPQALPPVGGTAEGPHDPRVPPSPEAPGQSSCASLKRVQEYQECRWQREMPTVATRGQGTPKELFTGSLYLWNRVPLPDSGPCLESSSSLFQVAGNPGARRPGLWV